MKIAEVAELLLLAALWGGSFLFMRIAAPVLGPVWLIESRLLLAGLVLLPILFRVELFSEVRRHLMPLLVLGGINSAFPFLLFAFASLYLPAGFNSILNATTPLFGMAIASVWLKEKLSGARLMGFLLGFAGVTVLVGWQPISATPTFLVAVAASLVGAFMYALGANYINKNLTGVPPLVVAAGSQLGAAFLLLPALPLTVPSQRPSVAVVGAVVALGLLSTALAYLLYFRLIRNIGSTRALTVAYLIPLFAMLWGALCLGETISPSMVLGCALVLLGTALSNNLNELLRKMLAGR